MDLLDSASSYRRTCWFSISNLHFCQICQFHNIAPQCTKARCLEGPRRGRKIILILGLYLISYSAELRILNFRFECVQSTFFESAYDSMRPGF